MPRTYRVLSVEDDDDQFALLRIALNALPLTLPDMRGWEVLDWLKTNSEVTTKIPVVMLTSHAETSHRVIAKLQEVAEYVRKPFAPDDFRAKVRGLLKIADE